jgi:predicted ribosome quality control (RQC) complex YloA/Tae2 family protein
VRKKDAAEIKRHEKLIANLRSDLEKHGEPDQWKRYGELLLASPSAQRRDGVVIVADLFDTTAPLIEIPGAANLSISEVAENYFRQYAKARNGQKMIAERMSVTESKLRAAKQTIARIDAAIAEENEEYLESLLLPPRKPIAVTRKKKKDTEFKGARRFISSDGFEILVGKKAADNDFLTFRVARSLDTWMHAADYPGSHVIIRNAGRKVIPERTQIEAAQIAAFYSDAREQPKAAVHYTLKKFVNKPKRSASGLVSLASFKTMVVEPQIPVGVIQP